MRQRAQIGYVVTTGHETETYEVIQPQEGNQGQVDGPQVLLSGHADVCSIGKEIENIVIQPLEGARD